MVRHIVMWNIAEGLNKEKIIPELKSRLEALPSQIPFIRKINLGVNFNDNETGRDVVLYSEFETVEDLENYIVHPAHKEVGVYVRSVVCDRIDVDCEV